MSLKITMLLRLYIFFQNDKVSWDDGTNSHPIDLNKNTLAEKSLIKRILATFISSLCMHMDSIF